MDYKNKLLNVALGCLLVVARGVAYYSPTYGAYKFILSELTADNSQGTTSLTKAQEWCSSRGYTLATIPDKDVQNDIEQFIKSSVNSQIKNIDVILLNGKLYTSLPNTWVWVNEQPRKGNAIKGESNDLSEHYFYGFLNTSDYYIYASTHNIGRSYICEYPGNVSNCAGGLSMNGRCYQAKDNTSLTWYSARNKCLEERGDLASFETLTDSDFSSALGASLLANTSTDEFWVGMQRAEWRWEDTELAIKYTSWECGSPTNAYDCLALRAAAPDYEWLWNSYDCSSVYRFICIESNQTSTMSKKPSSFTTSVQLNTVPIQEAQSSLGLGLGVGLGLGAAVIVIGIVAAVVAIRRKSGIREGDAAQVTSAEMYLTVLSTANNPNQPRTDPPQETQTPSETDGDGGYETLKEPYQSLQQVNQQTEPYQELDDYDTLDTSTGPEPAE